LLLGCGCGAAASGAAPASVARTSKAAKSLLNADRTLAAESHAIGFVAAYAKAMAPEARKFDGGQQPVIGRDSILALMARYPAGLSIDWTPEEAVVAENGELGFTWGGYVASVHAINGKLVVQHGKYLDVWQRQSDGTWRWIADIRQWQSSASLIEVRSKSIKTQASMTGLEGHQRVAPRRWRRSFLYFRLAQRTRSRSSLRIVG
jgi:ketosteroid isomerase-like protein